MTFPGQQFLYKREGVRRPVLRTLSICLSLSLSLLLSAEEQCCVNYSMKLALSQTIDVGDETAGAPAGAAPASRGGRHPGVELEEATELRRGSAAGSPLTPRCTHHPLASSLVAERVLVEADRRAPPIGASEISSPLTASRARPWLCAGERCCASASPPVPPAASSIPCASPTRSSGHSPSEAATRAARARAVSRACTPAP